MNSEFDQGGVFLRQTSIRSARDEEGEITRQTSDTRSPSTDLGTGHSSMGTSSSVQTPSAYGHYMKRFVDLASSFNWGVIVLTLGSYGLLLSTPVFWVCWSILVAEAVIFYSIRPYWDWIEKHPHTTDESEDSKKPHQPSENSRAGAVCLKVGLGIALITLILYSQDCTQRQNKILLFAGLSIMLFEGLPPIVIINKELRSLIRNPSGKSMQMLRSITEGHDWRVVNFLTPSVINAMIVVTGAIVLGSNLGSLMPEKPYWIFVSIFVVDLMAEAIHRFDCGNRSFYDPIPDTMPKRHYIAIVLRLTVEGFLCYWMTKEICQNAYFPFYVDGKTCNVQCQERSKSLLIAMVALGGLQAAGTFTTPLCSCVLGPQYVPITLFYAILSIGFVMFLLFYKFLRCFISAINRTMCGVLVIGG